MFVSMIFFGFGLIIFKSFYWKLLIVCEISVFVIFCFVCFLVEFRLKMVCVFCGGLLICFYFLKKFFVDSLVGFMNLCRVIGSLSVIDWSVLVR